MPADPRAAEEFYLRTFGEPALDVNGIESGSPHLQKTVLPVEAVANLSIRLAPGQKVAEIAPEVERLLRDAAPDGAELEVEILSSSPPGLVPPDAPAIRLGLDAFERVFGARPALVRSGGTLPIVPALADRGHPDDHHRLSASPTRTSTRRTSGSSPITCRSGSWPPASCSWRSPPYRAVGSQSTLT